MKRWTVYCHTHVESGRRYIGLTIRSMERRWSQHIIQAKHTKGNRSHFANAIRKYGKDAFSHEVLAQSWDLAGANATEETIIEQEGTRDPKIGFNLAKGGLHVPHPIRKNPWDRPEFRSKALASLAKANASLTPQQRSQHTKKLWSDPSFRENVLTATKVALSTPEAQKAMSLAQIAAKARPDVKKRHRETSKHMWESPEYRAQNATLWKDPEFRGRCQSGLIRGAALNAAKTHCRNGHEFTSDNTIIRSTGGRICRICDRINKARSARARRALKRQNLETSFIQ